LSFGQRKRICLAAALGGDPDVLILDEPTNGMDATACEYLAAVVRARTDRGKVTIAATHDARALDLWQPRLLRMVDGVVER
jgi:ABC-2 type transport system ATP-binding protein